MKKRIIAVVVSTLIVSLIACGRMDNNLEKTTDTVPVTKVDYLSSYENVEKTIDTVPVTEADYLSSYENMEKTTDAIPVEDANNLFFYDSIEAFLEAEKQNPKYGEESFFIPNLPPEEYQLVSVSKREDVYISLLYKVVNPADNTEKLSDYDAERRTILICQTYLSQNGLEMFIKNGFQETIFDGKSYYIWEEHADNDRERSINGYEIVFIKDGKRVFMYLPATESFENMMRYADPEKKIIGE